jgi:transposase
MLGLSRRVRVFAHPGPVDMRKGFYTLGAIVAASGHDIIAGDIFLFLGRCRRRVKILWFDGTGLVLLTKVLQRGRFAAIWERTNGVSPAELATSELMVFLEGSQAVGRGSIVQRTFSFDADPSSISA